MKSFASWAGPPGGKTSAGCFYGLKVHLLINHLGQIVQVRSGSTHDANLRVLYQLTQDLVGWGLGDKGYLLNTDREDFLERQGELIIPAKPRKGMAKADWPLAAKRYAKKRGLGETVIGQTTAVCNMEHTRHRSEVNAFVNLYASLVACSFYARKPMARVDISDRLIQSGEPQWATAV